MKKMLFISIVLMIALVACGAGQPAAETNSACGSVGQQMLNSVGEGYLFPDASSGPNNLTVNEGNTMALGSGDFVLYRADINSNGPTYLFGETMERQGIKITAYQCGGNIGFDIDIYPLQTFAELMLLQSDVNWNAWEQAIKETSYDAPADFASISVGVLNRETHKLMAIPSGLVIPHNEGWVNPPAQQEGEVTTFQVPADQVSGAVSRIEYVPQPGWAPQSVINKTATNGSRFIIFVVSPTAEEVDLTPFGYKGPITRLYTYAVSLTSGNVIPLAGFQNGGNVTDLLNTTAGIMVEIPVDPHDERGITEFLNNCEAIVGNGYVWTTNASGFHWEFDVTRGVLKYYFVDAQ